MAKKVIKKRRSKHVVVRMKDARATRRRIFMRPGTVHRLCAKLYKSSTKVLSILRKRLTISLMVPVSETQEDEPKHSFIGNGAEVRRVGRFKLLPFHGDELGVGKYYVTTRKNTFLLVVRKDNKVASLENAFSKMNL